MRVIDFILLFWIVITPVHGMSCAKGVECDPGLFTALLPVILIEGAIVAESTLAAYSPEEAGFIAGLSMWWAIPVKGEALGYGGWAWMLSAASMMTYNIVQEKNSNRGLDVFAVNFVGWHTALYLTDRAAHYSRSQRQFRFAPFYGIQSKSTGATVSFSF